MLHWNNRIEQCHDLDKDLLRYDLPLGMGHNDPLPMEDNPLFHGTNVQYNVQNDSKFPTANATHA